MIRIAITPAAYAAIAGTVPGNVGVENQCAYALFGPPDKTLNHVDDRPYRRRARRGE